MTKEEYVELFLKYGSDEATEGERVAVINIDRLAATMAKLDEAAELMEEEYVERGPFEEMIDHLRSELKIDEPANHEDLMELCRFPRRAK